jgi:hypothetical protein
MTVPHILADEVCSSSRRNVLVVEGVAVTVPHIPADERLAPTLPREPLTLALPHHSFYYH